MRTAEHLGGLGLLGSARVGPLSLEVPELLNADATPFARLPLRLSSEPAPSGTRRIVIESAAGRWPLDLPVLAPEIVAGGAGVHPLSDRAYLLHFPVPERALEALRSERPELLIVGNARALWNEGEPFVRALGAIRTAVGAGPVVWTPRVGLPHRLPLLVYLGVDLADTTEGELRSAEGRFLDLTLGERTRPSPGAGSGCDCSACGADPPRPLAAHAREMYVRSLAEVRHALRTGTLRPLVEARLVAEPTTSELLRHADRELKELLDERTAVVSDHRVTYVLTESLRRPEVARWRDRFLTRYRPPPSKEVLLLVPCSRTKPYRRSPSHRRFARALERLRAPERVHVVSVSSPLGTVPQELEDIPPARQYDIPVTGEWSETERSFVLAGVDHLLRNGRYRSVVVHLDPVEYGFVRDRLPSDRPVEWTVVDGRTTSVEAIERLGIALERALAGTVSVPGGPLAVVAEELREVASVQLGRVAAERLFAPPLRLAGRPWFQRVTDGRQELATLRDERGLFHLTVAGALRLGDAVLRVEADPALKLEGDLFVPGVRAADRQIRAGDSVGLFRAGRFAAIGEAVLPGALMTELGHGPAVRVRHRDHGPADTAKTGERSSPRPGPVVEG